VRTLLQDIRYAFRQLRSHPGFALTAILSLALGIGATVSVFSVIYGVIVHPYPYADLERLVSLSASVPSGDFSNVYITGPQLRELQQMPAIDKIAAWTEWDLTLTGHDAPEDVVAYSQTADSFPTLGISPLLGRNLGPSDSPPGQEPQPVVMLNYKFWQQHFNGDASVIGKTLELTHKKYTIIGVTRPHFPWGWGADVYLPQKITSDQALQLGVMLKLRPGVTYAAADAQLQPLLERFAKETPTHFPPKFKVDVQQLGYWTNHQLGGTLYLLFAAVAMLLAIGCGNVSILLLARGTAREHEFAVRSAVGASGSRIVRQLLTEALILSLTGAGLGILLAYRALSLIVAWLPQNIFPPATDISVNLPVLFFSVGLALLTGILFGLFPALQLAKPEVSQVMKSNSQKVAGNARGKHIHSVLISGQIALTLLLLTAAGAAIEGFLRMMRMPLGYDPHNVISVGIPVHENTYTTWAERVNYFEQLRAKIAEVPGITSTGISTNATPPANGDEEKFELLGKPSASPEAQTALMNFVDPGYFSTLSIPLLQGRLWNPTEVAHGGLLVLVNQSFAKLYYPNGDAIGHSLKIPSIKANPPYTLTAPGSDGWLQIIGVAGDALDQGMDKPVKPAIFMPYSVEMRMGTQFLVRSRSNPLALVHNIRQQMAEVNPDQQAYGEIDDLETWIRQEQDWARGRLISALFGAFSVLALVLSAIGLYSVVSYSVAQRTNEFGIRMALGARRGDVLKIVFASAGASVGLGLAVGLALSFGLSKMIASWVQNSSSNPLLIVGVSLLLLAVAALACMVPARRASSVDPMTALRCE
jgi:predicted permease